jgi:hypothetical protein
VRRLWADPLAHLPLSLSCGRRTRLRFDCRYCTDGATACRRSCLLPHRPPASRRARVPFLCRVAAGEADRLLSFGWWDYGAIATVAVWRSANAARMFANEAVILPRSVSVRSSAVSRIWRNWSSRRFNSASVSDCRSLIVINKWRMVVSCLVRAERFPALVRSVDASGGRTTPARA